MDGAMFTKQSCKVSERSIHESVTKPASLPAVFVTQCCSKPAVKEILRAGKKRFIIRSHRNFLRSTGRQTDRQTDRQKDSLYFTMFKIKAP